MSGLNLVGGMHRLDESHVVTAAVPGVSDGRLAQLFMAPWDPAVEERPVESTDEQRAPRATPAGGLLCASRGFNARGPRTPPGWGVLTRCALDRYWGVSATTILSGLRAIAEDDSNPSTSARVAAWRELAERVIGPAAQQRMPENHLHVNITPEEMRAVAQRLAASYADDESS